MKSRFWENLDRQYQFEETAHIAFLNEGLLLIKYVIKSKFRVLTVSLFGGGMAQGAITGAAGEMDLLTKHDVETGRVCRSVRLVASEDGKTILLVETDERKVGVQREYRFEITASELIALVRAHGAELPGENHVIVSEAC